MRIRFCVPVVGSVIGIGTLDFDLEGILTCFSVLSFGLLMI